ncbi:MAG: electron transfer flavoprotein subunit beta/FixA family protein [Acidobacteriota bacterium]
MNILVCIKQILDPDLPARDFKIDAEAKEAERGGANLVTNIFCENALETALQLKEKAGGGKVVALCYGTEDAEDSLRKALAMTVDEAVLVLRDGPSNPDPSSVAKALAAAIGKAGEFDLVLLGRESGDWGVGQTGGLLAEELGMSYLAFVDGIEPADGGVSVTRQTDAGIEAAAVNGPAVLTITNNEHNVPRIPKTRDVMMSYRKPLEKISAADLGLGEDAGGRNYYEVVDLFVPTKDIQCEFIEGDSVEDKVAALAAKIHEISASA